MNDKGILLIDGSCGLCVLAGRLYRKIDQEHFYEVVPFQSLSNDELRAHGLSYEECSRTVRLVTSNGRVLSGAFAVNRLLSHYTSLSLIAPAFLWLLPLEVLLYQLVNRYRHAISGLFGLKGAV